MTDDAELLRVMSGAHRAVVELAMPGFARGP
jgi:hypothetical protein